MPADIAASLGALSLSTGGAPPPPPAPRDPRGGQLLATSTFGGEPQGYRTLASLSEQEQMQVQLARSTRWGTALSSKVNLPYSIDFRAACGANLVTQHPGVQLALHENSVSVFLGGETWRDRALSRHKVDGFLPQPWGVNFSIFSTWDVNLSKVPEARCCLISQNVFINWFYKVKPPTKSSTYCSLLLIKILS